MALKAVRDDVAWLEDVFPHGTPDVEWLPVVGANGWLMVCRDKKMRTRVGERRQIIENRVGAFCLTQKENPTRWAYLKLLAATLDEMQSRFETTPRPFIFGVRRDGSFKPLYLRPVPPAPEPIA